MRTQLMPKLRFQLATGKTLKCASLDEFPGEIDAQVDFIDVQGCGLTEFEAKRFRQLQVLLINSNQLIEFPNFRHNKRLKYLQIYSNHFDRIDPRRIPPNLQEVIVDDLGCWLYPLAKTALVKVYNGFGEFSGHLTPQ